MHCGAAMTYKLKVAELDKVPSAEDFLTERELKEYSSFKIEKRRREWLGGRYALKQLACNQFNFGIKEMEVKNLPSGKPVLLVPGGTHLPVSITHSGIYAAAAIGLTGDDIGIDMEVIEQRSRAWAEQSFEKEEFSSNAAFFLTELWAKKEAVLKFLGVGLSINMKDIRFINGKLNLYGRALDIWAEKGSPVIQTDVQDLDGGYKLVVANEIPLL